MSHFGHFSKEGDEYIISRPDTPKPWINHITNGRYCALISQTGGGYSFVDDSGYNRILKEQPGEELIYDRPGRYIYVRDNENEDIWGLTWQPTCHEVDFFEARHGMGYTTIKSRTHDIESEITYFVPTDETCEIWMVKLTNKSQKARQLSIFPYVEWSLGNNAANLAEASFNDLFNDFDFKDNTIFATKRRWDRPDTIAVPWNKVAFLTMNLPVDGFDCFKEKFVGMYGSLARPKAVAEGKCTGSIGDGHHSVGALQKDLALKAGESIFFDVILGTEDREVATNKARKLNATDIEGRAIKKYSHHQNVLQSFEELKKNWRSYLTKNQVKTPDPDFDISLNYWNKYQAWMTAQWSLMDSYYVGGGATIGFRDMCQHILGTLPNNLEFSKQRTKSLLSFQFSEGKTVHNWDKLLNKGKVTDHSDDTQWLIMAVINYINESGELSFLEEKVPYYDIGEGTVLEHVVRAMEHTIYHSSNRHIPHRRTADWNDALNGGREGKGESAMVANQMCWNLKNLAPLLKAGNQNSLADSYERLYEKIKKALNESFWDGGWYIRATDDFQKPIGSHHNKEAKIDINGQSWPIISGVADEQRGEKAMDAVWKHLMTDYGPVMFTPAFSHPSDEYGIISQFTPGTKENGAIFNHPVSWAVIAECILGRGDKAYEMWRRTSFVTRGKNPVLYRVEPYVYAEFVYGPAHPEFGRGSFTWTTGSASWFWRACLDYICGVRPTIEGLMIDPCIPKDWRSLEITRWFRGAEYIIKVTNPSGVEKGVRSVVVDGEEMANNIVPVKNKGKHLVEVIMGTPIKKTREKTGGLAQLA